MGGRQCPPRLWTESLSLVKGRKGDPGAALRRVAEGLGMLAGPCRCQRWPVQPPLETLLMAVPQPSVPGLVLLWLHLNPPLTPLPPSPRAQLRAHGISTRVLSKHPEVMERT